METYNQCTYPKGDVYYEKNKKKYYDCSVMYGCYRYNRAVGL